MGGFPQTTSLEFIGVDFDSLYNRTSFHESSVTEIVRVP
jgi:hypothetical protein